MTGEPVGSTGGAKNPFGAGGSNTTPLEIFEKQMSSLRLVIGNSPSGIITQKCLLVWHMQFVFLLVWNVFQFPAGSVSL